MGDKHLKSSVTGIIGTALVTSLSAANAAAEDNPFLIRDLETGYQHVVEAGKEKKEMTCGEGRCGAEMMKKPEMKCGAGMQELMKQQEAKREKTTEGKCAGTTPQQPAAESKTN